MKSLFICFCSRFRIRLNLNIETLQEVLLFLAEKHDRSGVRTALEELWEKTCNMKTHSEALAEFQHPDASSFTHLFEPSKCYMCGLCVCAGSPGELALWFHNNLVSLYKPFLKSSSRRSPVAVDAVDSSRNVPVSEDVVAAAEGSAKPGPIPKQKPKPKSKPPKKPGRIMMEDGFLVLCLEKGGRQQSLDEFEAGWDAVETMPPPNPSLAPPLLGSAALPEKQSLWFHIGFANYSSWNFSLCRLFVDEDSARSSESFSEPRPNRIVRLQVGEPNRIGTDKEVGTVRDAFKVSFAAFREFIDDWDCEWFASFYSVLTNNDIVPVVPSLTEVSPCHIFPRLRVWKAWGEKNT